MVIGYLIHNYLFFLVLVEAEGAAEAGELHLFGPGKDVHGADDACEMGGPNFFNEGTAVIGQVNIDTAAIFFAALAIDEATLDEIINDEGHVAATF